MNSFAPQAHLMVSNSDERGKCDKENSESKTRNKEKSNVSWNLPGEEVKKKFPGEQSGILKQKRKSKQRVTFQENYISENVDNLMMNNCDILEEIRDFDKLKGLEIAANTLLEQGEFHRKENKEEHKKFKQVEVDKLRGRGVGEQRGEDKQGTESDDDVVVISGVNTENRNFLMLKLGEETYKTLLDPGATLSLVGPKVAEKLAPRLLPSNTRIPDCHR